MKLVLLGLAVVAAAQVGSYRIVDMDPIIDHVNNIQTTWSAGHNFARDTPRHYFKRLMGVKKNANSAPLKKMTYSGLEIPKSFDVRQQWPKCPTTSHVLDQGNCGSCWAVATASAFSDRLCIATNGTFTNPISAADLGGCCTDCGYGCDGGDPASAWEYLVDTGLVTGGDYGSSVGCKPYPIPACEHHVKGPLPACSSLPDGELDCSSKCQNSKYKTSYDKDLHKGSTSYSFDSVEAAQEDMLKYGSIEAAFSVYDDFLAYKSGVYQQVTGEFLGGHAVRVLGWGEENNVPYWLVANSWNDGWGDKGTFKIIRGSDNCGFEDDLVAGRIN